MCEDFEPDPIYRMVPKKNEMYNKVQRIRQMYLRAKFDKNFKMKTNGSDFHIIGAKGVKKTTF